MTKMTTPSSGPPQHHRAWQDLLRTQKSVLAGLETHLAKAHRLPVAWYYILLFLNETPGQRLQLYELADVLLLSRSGLSRRIDGMVRAGLVRRDRPDNDRRSAFAVLTPKGQEQLMAASPDFRAGVVQHFARHLTDEEANTLVALLSKVLDGEQVDRHYAGPRLLQQLLDRERVVASSLP